MCTDCHGTGGPWSWPWSGPRGSFAAHRWVPPGRDHRGAHGTGTAGGGPAQGTTGPDPRGLGGPVSGGPVPRGVSAVPGFRRIPVGPRDRQNRGQDLFHGPIAPDPDPTL